VRGVVLDVHRFRRLGFDVDLEAVLRQQRSEEFARMNRRGRATRLRARVGLVLFALLAYATFLIWLMSNERAASPCMGAGACSSAASIQR
jgi:hypothetical protein